ncbi:8090_t:CDS:2 [Ambispora gerdemannii]|uniref:8090_t:CDS:1 n=1 Tax=Ambispora gerdemannii TaxID=144530 RepID=A0A9N9A0X9_9GLOM|nr:8090_t:CDS:2 [Ambispora gerdemannii]
MAASPNPIVNAIQNSVLTFCDALLLPLKKAFFKPSSVDLTYGRVSLPFSPTEQTLRQEPYIYTDYSIPFPFKGEFDRFIYYQTWSLSTVKQRDTDFVWLHGLNDYGGRFSQHCLQILEQGFRVISIDLPSFGRSSGLHACIKDWEELTEAVRVVITHVKEQNANNTAFNKEKKRRVILGGGSMGGFIAISYAIKYPTDIDAFSVLCPLIYVAGASRPSKIIEYIAKVIVASPLGTLPLTPASRDKGHWDPAIEQAFLSDPQTYHGNMRACTGIMFLNGITWLQQKLGLVKKPFLTQHGLSDRVCEDRSSRDLFAQAQTPDEHKTMILYENCEHDMLHEHCSQKVMQDLIEWMIKIDKVLENGLLDQYD